MVIGLPVSACITKRATHQLWLSGFGTWCGPYTLKYRRMVTGRRYSFENKRDSVSAHSLEFAYIEIGVPLSDSRKTVPAGRSPYTLADETIVRRLQPAIRPACR